MHLEVLAAEQYGASDGCKLRSWSDVYKADPKVEEEDGITLKELLPIILACAIWRPHWHQSSALIHCDNEGTVAVVNSGYSRVEKVMHLLRCLFFIRA